MVSTTSRNAKSIYPTAVNTLGVAVRNFMDGELRALECCMPAYVYAYDRITHKADVMPLVKIGTLDKEWVYEDRPLIKGVTVRNIQCGGFTIDFPVHIGDTGWVFSSDRDTTLLKQEGALTNSVLAKNRPVSLLDSSYQQKPNQPTVHTFQNGFFLPDNWGIWENSRYKDYRGLPLDNALYIGASIDTADTSGDDESQGYQKGDQYEQKSTASIVLQDGGGATIASSTSDEKKQNSHISVAGGEVGISVQGNRGGEEGADKISSAIDINTDDGIMIRSISDWANANSPRMDCNLKPDSFLFRLINPNAKGDDGKSGLSMLSISFSNGKLNISTTGDVNVRSEKNINVQSAQNAYVVANQCRVVAEENASVTAKTVSASAAEKVNIASGNEVNIGAVEKTNINAGKEVNLAAGERINLTAPKELNLIAASDINLIAKKRNANIQVITKSRNSPISLKTEGALSNINVSANGDFHIWGNKAHVHTDLIVDGQTSTQSLVINGLPVKSKSHGAHDGANYWAWS